MGIFNLVFRILGATPRVWFWFAPGRSDRLRARPAGTHARVPPGEAVGGRAVGRRKPPRPARAPLAVPAPPPPPHKMAAGPEPVEPPGGKMAAAG